MHGCVALLGFSQLPLASQGVFVNLPPFLKSISQLEGHFAAWRWFRSHFKAWRSFRSKMMISQPIGDFAAKGQFRSQGAFSQPFCSQRGISQAISQPISQLRNGSVGLRNGTRVPKGRLAVAKIFAGVAMGLRNDFSRWSFSQGAILGYEIS